MTIRLHMLCAASTPSFRAIGFPADEALDLLGRESLSRLSGRLPSFDVALRSPALCAHQTAEGLGVEAVPEPMLRDCDFGRWSGRSLVDVQTQEPDAVAAWLRDQRAAPHGGESFVDVMERIGRWMDGHAQSETILAITHPTNLRAAVAWALGSVRDCFRHVDIAPLSRVMLSGCGGRWTLKALISLKDAA